MLALIGLMCSGLHLPPLLCTVAVYEVLSIQDEKYEDDSHTFLYVRWLFLRRSELCCALRIRWKGCSADQDSWEPFENLLLAPQVLVASRAP